MGNWAYRNRNFLTDSCKSPSEIMGAQTFNFAPKFPQMGDFQLQILYFQKKIFGRQKFMGNCTLATMRL